MRLRISIPAAVVVESSGKSVGREQLGAQVAVLSWQKQQATSVQSDLPTWRCRWSIVSCCNSVVVWTQLWCGINPDQRTSRRPPHSHVAASVAAAVGATNVAGCKPLSTHLTPHPATQLHEQQELQTPGRVFLSSSANTTSSSSRFCTVLFASFIHHSSTNAHSAVRVPPTQQSCAAVGRCRQHCSCGSGGQPGR